jgi:acyltransferase
MPPRGRASRIRHDVRQTPQARLAMTARSEGRYVWIDVAKSVGIYLIVFSHLDQSGFSESFLWTFHVPLFFFVSGYLTRPQSAGEFLGNVTRKLLLPYIGIYTVIALLRSDLDVQSFLRAMAGVVYGTRSYPYFVNDALWFLPSLITVETLYVLCIRRLPATYLLFLTASYLLYRQHDLDLFLSIDLSLLGLNYFLAGVLARRFEAFRWLAANRGGAVIVGASSCAATAVAASVGNVWYAGEHYALSLAAGLAGILMVVCLSMLVAPLLERNDRARSLFAFVSSNTLFIFCFHVFSNPFASALLEPIALGPPLIRAVATAAVSMAVLVPFNLLVRRFLPELIGLMRNRALRKPA